MWAGQRSLGDCPLAAFLKHLPPPDWKKSIKTPQLPRGLTHLPCALILEETNFSALWIITYQWPYCSGALRVIRCDIWGVGEWWLFTLTFWSHSFILLSPHGIGSVHAKYPENGRAGGGQHYWMGVYKGPWSEGKGTEWKVEQKRKELQKLASVKGIALSESFHYSFFVELRIIDHQMEKTQFCFYFYKRGKNWSFPIKGVFCYVLFLFCHCCC